MDCPTDRPTDRSPTSENWYDNLNYLSIRLTIGHENDNAIIERLLGDIPYWIFYRHGSGSQGERRQHYHIAIAIGDSNPGRESDKFRNRIKRLFKLGGNKEFSIVHKNNGLHSFIFYCSHEDPENYVFGSGYDDDWSRIFEKCREVNDGRYYEKGSKKRHFDGEIKDDAASRKIRHWQLTFTNLVHQAVLHTKRTKQDFGALKFCVKDMIKTTNWRPSRDLLKKGIPKFYEDDYVFMMGKSDKVDMSWWDENAHRP